MEWMSLADLDQDMFFFLFAAQNRRKVSAQEYDPFPRGKAVPSLPRLLASIFTVRASVCDLLCAPGAFWVLTHSHLSGAREFLG